MCGQYLVKLVLESAIEIKFNVGLLFSVRSVFGLVIFMSFFSSGETQMDALGP